MAKGAYLGVGGKASKIKSMYFGMEGKARAVKKVYVGIGGKARPCWSSGGVEYYGAIGPLAYPMQFHAAAALGGKAFFGGSSSVPRVCVYDSSLVQIFAPDLTASRYNLAAAATEKNVLFGGGFNFGPSITSFTSDIVDTYNESIVRGTATKLSAARYALAATTVGGYTLFGGGEFKPTTGGLNTKSERVDAYNAALSRSTPTALSVARADLAATTIGKYALFAGGSAYPYHTVDAYNETLARSIPQALSVGRHTLAASSNNNYALFGGGQPGVGFSNVVDAYDTTLVRSTPLPLSQARLDLGSASVGDYILFGGGNSGGANYSAVVDAYDDKLTHSELTELSVGRYGIAAVTVGSYALFGGGHSFPNIVDAYTAI